jgi:hypothetical protein
MKARIPAALGALLCVGVAQGLTLQTVISDIYQNGETAGVYLGHSVISSTPMNRLTAGGTFEAKCVSPYTGSITGQRTLSSTLLTGNQLYVTIPEWHPALADMPGFDFVEAGSTLSCGYYWTSVAEEATYSVGIPGFGITVGGAKGSQGGTVPFTMHKPANDVADDTGCIH